MDGVAKILEAPCKKRGRKLGDGIDVEIRESRKKIHRGLPSVVSCCQQNSDSEIYDELFMKPYDDIVRKILDRELKIVKEKELIEIREVPIGDESNSLGGSPVSTRLAIPPASVAKCLNNAMSQMNYYEQTCCRQIPRGVNFTPEAHIFMSKACELMIIELTSRSFLAALHEGSPAVISASSISNAVKGAWKSSNLCPHADSFDFLLDRVDRFEVKDRGILDRMGLIHREV
jgi:hypothetical protein